MDCALPLALTRAPVSKADLLTFWFPNVGPSFVKFYYWVLWETEFNMPKGVHSPKAEASEHGFRPSTVALRRVLLKTPLLGVSMALN